MANCPIDQLSFFDQICKDSVEVHISICVNQRETEPNSSGPHPVGEVRALNELVFVTFMLILRGTRPLSDHEAPGRCVDLEVISGT